MDDLILHYVLPIVPRLPEPLVKLLLALVLEQQVRPRHPLLPVHHVHQVLLRLLVEPFHLTREPLDLVVLRAFRVPDQRVPHPQLLYVLRLLLLVVDLPFVVLMQRLQVVLIPVEWVVLTLLLLNLFFEINDTFSLRVSNLVFLVVWVSPGRYEVGLGFIRERMKLLGGHRFVQPGELPSFDLKQNLLGVK